MASDSSIVYYGPGRPGPSPAVSAFARDWGLDVDQATSPEEVIAVLNRTFPACLVLDARSQPDPVLELCRPMQQHASTSIVPVVRQVLGGGKELSADALEGGADEVMNDGISEREMRLRLELMLRRAERDVSVHPTTRLPGTVQIERDLMERMARDEKFGV